MKIFLIRHGYAKHNYGYEKFGEKIFYDPAYFDPELMVLGHQQSKEAGKRLVKINFSKIYCSPLKRCIQTLDNLLSTSKVITDTVFRTSKNEFIILDDRLMEPQGYQISNKRHEKVEIQKYVSQLDKMFDLTNVSLNYDFDIESQNDINNRIKSFISNIKITHNDDDNILIVTHHNWLKFFFKIFTGKDVSFNNCEIRVIDMKSNSI
jgi:broad specificity phosphatase PhoE